MKNRVLSQALTRLNAHVIVMIAMIFGGEIWSEELLADYFDIKTGSGSGSVVYGAVHLSSNRNSNPGSVSSGYSFGLNEAGDARFEIEGRRDSLGRLTGVLRVRAGQTLPAIPQIIPVQVILFDESGKTVATTNPSIRVVDKPIMNESWEYLRNFALGESRLYMRKYTDQEVDDLITLLEETNGQVTEADGSPIGIYNNPINFYIGKGTYESEWAKIINTIGGLGYSYATSSKYGPKTTDSLSRTRLRKCLYMAISAFVERIPMRGSDLVAPGEAGYALFGEGFNQLHKKRIVSYGTMTHQWDLSDPLTGPAIWLAPDIFRESEDPDPAVRGLARRTQENLVNFFQICFSNLENYQSMERSAGRWGNITDVNHSGGAYADANQGHRSRGWVSLLGIWADYNRPITYMHMWYPDFFVKNGIDYSYKPGWSPRGVVMDLKFWMENSHTKSHLWKQSGFHPDGTVTHHVEATGCDVLAYGYAWLTDMIDGLVLLRQFPFKINDSTYQFISDRYLFAYDKFIYKGDIDPVIAGRGYSGKTRKYAAGIPGMVNKLLSSKQIGNTQDGISATFVKDEDRLVAWSESIQNNSQAVSGNFPFWVSQYQVHRRGVSPEVSYFSSFKMKNDRTNGAENFNSVNKSYHCGSGILFIKLTGNEYENPYNNLDWNALPGLTEEWRTDSQPSIRASELASNGVRPFAGMASDGRIGFSSMEYEAQPHSYASARAFKSAFFWDNDILALGCEVARVNPGQPSGQREIVTTVDQTIYKGQITYSVDDGQVQRIDPGSSQNITLEPHSICWIQQGECGYTIIPQGKQPVYLITRMTSKGAQILQISLGHGLDPEMSDLTKYLYIISPNKSVAEMPEYSKSLLENAKVLRNDKVIQSVVDARTGIVQISFHGAGSVSYNDVSFSADRPALLQVSPEIHGYRIAMTDPLHDLTCREINYSVSLNLAAGVYPYNLGGIYPRPGKTIEVSQSPSGANIRYHHIGADDDAQFDYVAPLLAGAPISILMPRVSESGANGDGNPTPPVSPPPSVSDVGSAGQTTDSSK